MALRVMAGFEKNDGYYLPRSRVMPPDELLAMVWPFLEYVILWLERDENSHPTAIMTLQYWQELRVVLLQDVAAMFAQMDDDDPLRNHLLFQMPVFCCDAFKSFVAKMKEKLAHDCHDDNDPNLKSVDRAMPGVNRQFQRLRDELAEINASADAAAEYSLEAADASHQCKDKITAVATCVDDLGDDLLTLAEYVKKDGKKTRRCIRTLVEHMQQIPDVEGDSDDDGTQKLAAMVDSPSSPQPLAARRRAAGWLEPRNLVEGQEGECTELFFEFFLIFLTVFCNYSSGRSVTTTFGRSCHGRPAGGGGHTREFRSRCFFNVDIRAGKDQEHTVKFSKC